MRYRLRTLLILLAILPPIAGLWLWPHIKVRYEAWKLKQQTHQSGFSTERM
jgi:hypothetical protein